MQPTLVPDQCVPLSPPASPRPERTVFSPWTCSRASVAHAAASVCVCVCVCGILNVSSASDVHWLSLSAFRPFWLCEPTSTPLLYKRAYLKVATKLHVGQPTTKLLSELVRPSHTSSMQLDVHISHTRTWAFTLKWVGDLQKTRFFKHHRTFHTQNQMLGAELVVKSSVFFPIRVVTYGRWTHWLDKPNVQHSKMFLNHLGNGFWFYKKSQE